MQKNNKINLSGVVFNALNHDIILSKKIGLKHVVTVNAEFIVRAQNDQRFKNIINKNYSTIDGQLVYLLLKIKYFNYNFKKISGCDFIYDLCEFSRKNKKKVFLLGGYEKSNKLAVLNLKNKYNIEIEGFSPKYMPYPFNKKHNNNILDQIKGFQPDVLFVGFGAVKQELWIHDNRKFLENNNVSIAIGIGGTFDYISGTIKRAPVFFQKTGLEIFYRLYAEPSLIRVKRIFISLKIFYYFLKPKSRE